MSPEERVARRSYGTCESCGRDGTVEKLPETAFLGGDMVICSEKKVCLLCMEMTFGGIIQCIKTSQVERALATERAKLARGMLN